MKVTSVKSRVLAIPNNEPYYYSQGVGQGVNCVLVEVETDEGITGIGEACGDRSAEAIVEVVRAAAAKSSAGSDLGSFFFHPSSPSSPPLPRVVSSVGGGFAPPPLHRRRPPVAVGAPGSGLRSF